MVHVCLRHISPGISEYAEEKRREQNLLVRSGKSEAEVTNNRTLLSTYCTIEANYCTKHRAASAIAGLLVLLYGQHSGSFLTLKDVHLNETGARIMFSATPNSVAI